MAEASHDNTVGQIHESAAGLNGFIIPDENPEAIAEKLSLLIDDSELRTRMGKAGLKHLKKNFTVEKMTEAIEGVYYKVVQRRV